MRTLTRTPAHGADRYILYYFVNMTSNFWKDTEEGRKEGRKERRKYKLLLLQNQECT